jgi:uncharacterized protein with HEPN domain
LNRDKLYVKHILESIRRVHEDIHGDERVFRSNRTIQDAVVRNLQVMAESTKRLSDVAKASQPAIPWHQIAQFRNRIVHDYLHVDYDVVWDIIQNDLGPLKVAVEEIQKTLP